MFCLGLAQNAMQYLSEIIVDFGHHLQDLTLVHKRLKNLDSFEFFNPFNLIVDHPLKDLCELYKNDYLSFEELQQKLNFYHLDSKSASVFVARMLIFLTPSNHFSSISLTEMTRDAEGMKRLAGPALVFSMPPSKQTRTRL